MISTRDIIPRLKVIESLAIIPRVASTNLVARRIVNECIENELSLPQAMIIAREQLAGRGRNQRSWSSPPGKGIYATTLVTRTAQEMSLMPLNMATIVAEYLRDAFGIEARIKWPMNAAGAERLMTARGRALIAAFDEHAAPKYDCSPAGLPIIFGDPWAVRIEQLADRVTFTYEKDDVTRTVWLEGHGHQRPRAGLLFMHGYSTGRYEGNQLVVETTRFTFDPEGFAGDVINAPSSTQKRLVERYSRVGNALRLELTAEDPVFLLGPITYTIDYPETKEPLSLPWNCDPASAQRNLNVVKTKYPQDPPITRRNAP